MSTKHVRTAGDLVRFKTALKIECVSCGNSRTLSSYDVVKLCGAQDLQHRASFQVFTMRGARGEPDRSITVAAQELNGRRNAVSGNCSMTMLSFTMAKGKTLLTPQQLAEMTDEQIIASTSDFSYDVSQCERRLRAGGDWNRVIQAHLFYDHVLTIILEEALHKPEYVQIDRMTFVAKVDLCAALSLIEDYHRVFLRNVNKLRNCIAHNLSFKVTRIHARRLYELHPKEVREAVDDWRKGSSLMFGTLFIFAVVLDIARQRAAVSRLLEQRGQVQLRKALDRVRQYTNTLTT